MSARAAVGLRLQSKIVAQEKAGQAVGGLCFTRLPDEHTIWQSEVRLKRGRWGHGHVSAVEPDMSMEAEIQILDP